MYMKDLKQIRESKGIPTSKMWSLLKTTRQCYFQYENGANIPIDKYVAICGFLEIPLPRDFHLYNGYTLLINKVYHQKTTDEINKLFGVGKRFFTRTELTDNLYEYKDIFLKVFNPIIYPCTVDDFGMPIIFDAIVGEPTVKRKTKIGLSE